MKNGNKMIEGKYLNIFVIILFFLNASFLSSQDVEKRKNELRAYFIYTVTKYIEWDNLSDSKYFIIGIIVDSELDASLKKIAKKKKVKNKKIIIRKYSLEDEIQKCHILIIPDTEKDNRDLILKKIDGKQVLSIGYSNGFAKNGVCINLIDYQGRIGFEINKKSIDKNKLKASSQLLKLAKKIY